MKTNDAGLYSLTQLPIGVWTLTVEHPGFRTYVQDGITLSTGDLLGINIVIDVGVVWEKVTVTAEAPITQSRTSDIGQLINSDSVENLPLGDRRSIEHYQHDRRGSVCQLRQYANAKPNFSLAGGRTQSQMFWIDGGSARTCAWAWGRSISIRRWRAVEEIKVLSNNNSARIRRIGGRRSSWPPPRAAPTSFTAAAYEYLRNDAMDAPGFFAPVMNGRRMIAGAALQRVRRHGGRTDPARQDFLLLLLSKASACAPAAPIR